MGGRRNPMVQTPRWLGRVFSSLHRGWYRLTRGSIGRRFRGLPVVLLTTNGRKTGNERTWPLLAVREGETYAFTASNSGHDRHPAWYLNLEADPAVTVRDGRRTIPGRARITAGAERAALFQRFVDAYPTYGDYAEATERQIPVVVVEPV